MTRPKNVSVVLQGAVAKLQGAEAKLRLGALVHRIPFMDCNECGDRELRDVGSTKDLRHFELSYLAREVFANVLMPDVDAFLVRGCADHERCICLVNLPTLMASMHIVRDHATKKSDRPHDVSQASQSVHASWWAAPIVTCGLRGYALLKP